MTARWCRRTATDPLALTVALVTGALVAGLGGWPPLVWCCLAAGAGHALSGSV
ncbi:MAG: hypothetical protein ACRD0K_04110 [Egibacteraceae bacterium]